MMTTQRIASWLAIIAGALPVGGLLGWAVLSLFDHDSHAMGLGPLLVGVPVGALAGVGAALFWGRGLEAPTRLRVGLGGVALAVLGVTALAVLVQLEIVRW